ncbi:MAG: helix-turn-helix domain-containing protein [Candidatus Hydrogenedentes bacterium]|nr:helix-turn-helix domain-containing protein [Candidatus Hydrogenedentota bacterium]
MAVRETHDGREWPSDWPLLPMPRHISLDGWCEARVDGALTPHPTLPEALDEVLRCAVKSFPAAPRQSRSNPLPESFSSIAINPDQMHHRQGYTIHIRPSRGKRKSCHIAITAHDETGVFYAAQTLRQIGRLARECNSIPTCRIEDWPDIPNRGVMLDVAQDKVPEMKFLFEMVDLFASWKYNQLQLYTEHTFACEGHHVVWEDASPLTPVQVRDLDRYCRERYIQLVPNQNSLAHLGRWLEHPKYAGLAEISGGDDLCTVDPRTFDLLRSIYASMLPNFSSPLVNVGCEETWSLGQGRSEGEVLRRGVGRVYLEFLLRVLELVREHGKAMQFWGDIVNRHPELACKLPLDMIAMEWGYEADHPYPEHAQRFHDHGVRFYVVPGTSSWSSFLGRTDNALANLRSAAETGRDYGAEGYLVADWRDAGHWEFPPISYLPLLYGAAVSWCLDTNVEADVAKLADLYAFHDAAGVMGRVAYDLGNAHKLTGVTFRDTTAYYQVLRHFLEKPLTYGGLERLQARNLEKTSAYIDSVLARMDIADLRCPHADLIVAEIRLNAELAKFACRLGAARIQAGRVPTSGLPKEVYTLLMNELDSLIAEYRRLWLERNRAGGLKDSVGRMPGQSFSNSSPLLSEFAACYASPPPADLLRILRYIVNNISGTHGLHELTAYSGLSRATIGRLFKRYLRCAPGEWILQRRMEEAQRLLRTSAMHVSDVGAAVGIDDPYYFSKLFKKACGISPLEYRKSHRLP